MYINISVDMRSIRPYLLHYGPLRSISENKIGERYLLHTLLKSNSDRGISTSNLSYERLDIYKMCCHNYYSIAELSARIDVPILVTYQLVRDMVDNLYLLKFTNIAAENLFTKNKKNDVGVNKKVLNEVCAYFKSLL